MKLELKHISSYLPYGLSFFEIKLKKSYLCSGLNNSSLFFAGLKTSRNLWEVKPILRTMSDLTKEITHNGETFIPIIWLYNISNEAEVNKKFDFEFIESWSAGKILKVYNYNKSEYTEFIFHKGNFRKDTHQDKGLYRFGMNLPHSIKIHSELKNQLSLFQKLFEWHFDVFGLIDAGLAIDINTVPELLNG